MNPRRRWPFGLVTMGLVLWLFSSWMLQITLPPRPLAPTWPRTGPRKLARGAPALRAPGRDKRSESGHAFAPLAWTFHEPAEQLAAG
jgi:hypothetical protein